MSRKQIAPIGRIVLFNGKCINIAGGEFDLVERKNETLSDEEINETLKVITIAMSRISRWNGHLRIPFSLITKFLGNKPRPSHVTPFTNGIDMNVKGDGNIPYVFYTDLNHCFLVATIIERITADKDMSEKDRQNLILQALLHEIGEVIISDIVGPLKKLLKGVIKPIENNIEAIIANDINVEFPWNPIIKKADIIAQDIEAYFGYANHVRGVNLTEKFTCEEWMEKTLFDAIMVSPSDFYNKVLKTYEYNRKP